MIQVLKTSFNQEIRLSIPPEVESLLLSSAHVLPVQKLALEASQLVLERYQIELDELATKIRRSIEQIGGVLAPIRLLPDELIVEICRHAKGDRYTSHYHIVGSKAPWVFSQVCRRWRTVVLSASRLWSSLNLLVARRVPDPTPWTEARFDMLRECVRRTGASPLSIYLSASGGNSPQEDVAIIKLYDFLVDHSEKLESLHMELYGDCLSFQQAIRLKGRLPRLKELYIQRSTLSIFDTVFRDAPALVDVTIEEGSSVPIPTFTASLSDAQRLPFHQLTHISYLGPVQSIATILSHAPNLVSYHTDSGSNRLHTVPVVHTNLRRLHCTARSLYGLTIPNLEYLSVCGMRENANIQYFTSFLAAPHCFLQHLVVEGTFDKPALSTFA